MSRPDRRDAAASPRVNPDDAGLDERAARALRNENTGPAARRAAVIGVRAGVGPRLRHGGKGGKR